MELKLWNNYCSPNQSPIWMKFCNESNEFFFNHLPKLFDKAKIDTIEAKFIWAITFPYYSYLLLWKLRCETVILPTDISKLKPSKNWSAQHSIFEHLWEVFKNILFYLQKLC